VSLQAKSLRTIIMTVAISIPALGNISLLMMICLYIYSAFCHNLFWSVYYTPLVFEDNYGGGRIYPDDYYYTNGNSNDGDYINRHANSRNMLCSAVPLVILHSTPPLLQARQLPQHVVVAAHADALLHGRELQRRDARPDGPQLE
jgi:hypothetical protein